MREPIAFGVTFKDTSFDTVTISVQTPRILTLDGRPV